MVRTTLNVRALARFLCELRTPLDHETVLAYQSADRKIRAVYCGGRKVGRIYAVTYVEEEANGWTLLLYLDLPLTYKGWGLVSGGDFEYPDDWVPQGWTVVPAPFGTPLELLRT